MSYLYETHLHTCYSSACGVSKGSEYIKRYIDAGFSGIIVTDHFFRGNCAVRGHVWREWVKRYCRGWEEAWNEGQRRGLPVFFGWEETFDGDDYLVYGLDREWLLGREDARNWSRADQYREVNAAGGCVVQAHPFRQHFYIHRITLAPDCVDGIEIANAGNGDASYDALAKRYAEKAGRTPVAGSDIHEVSQFDTGDIYGAALDKKMESIADYVRAVKTGEGITPYYGEGRCDWRGGERLHLPAEILDKTGRRTDVDVREFLGIKMEHV